MPIEIHKNSGLEGDEEIKESPASKYKDSLCREFFPMFHVFPGFEDAAAESINRLADAMCDEMKQRDNMEVW